MEKRVRKEAAVGVAADVKRRAERSSYVHRKQGVLEAEKDNDRKVMVFRGNGKWWRIVGKSVVYYSKIVGPRLARSVVVHPDDDYGETSKYGVINVPDIARFIDEMKGLDLEVVGKGDKDFIYVRLKQKVSEEEFNTLIREEDEKWSIAEKMVMPTVSWPALKTQILATLAETRHTTRKFDASLSRQMGDPMMESVLHMLQVLQLASRGRLEPSEALLSIGDDLLVLDSLIMAVMHIRVLTIDRIFKLSTATMNLKRALDKEISKNEKKISASAQSVPAA